MTKTAPADYTINELIAKRWSPRSFSDQIISNDSLNIIFEAARWAASAGNEQPWEYIYGQKGTDGFETLWDCLLPGNQPWVINANVLMVAVTRKTFAGNGKINGFAAHDLGMANAQLFLQATALDIYCHPMGGFDKIKLRETLQLSDNIEPVCMIAMGYADVAEKLDEPFRTRELAARLRQPIETFTKRI